MVASSRTIVVTNLRAGIGNSSSSGIDDMILTNGTTSPSSTSTPVIRRNRKSKVHRTPGEESKVTNIRNTRIAKTEMPETLSLSSANNNHRRVRSDNLTQSKRDDPHVRRSIFGHYFKEKPRSYSAPAPTAQVECRKQPSQFPNLRQESPLQSFRRSSSSSGSISSLPVTPQKDIDPIEDNGLRRRDNCNHASKLVLPVDYRVFAPSEQQVEESAICGRYRDLNREHQKDYDSLLERQVQIERTLPPFPTPLIRFCSDTTAAVVGSDSSSSSKKPINRSGYADYFSSSDGEIHYHGVYPLLKPISILRPSTYVNTTSTTTNEFPTGSSPPNSNSAISIQTELERPSHELSAPLSSSFNLTRSCIENSTLLKNFTDAQTDLALGISMNAEGEEEKKENESAFMTVSKTQDSTVTASPFLHPNILLAKKEVDRGSSSNENNTSYISDNFDGNDCCDNNPQGEPLYSEEMQHRRRLRFDPRVTVTEFEDPIPRKWYNESELDQHRREAIALAQLYLRKHPAVAGWYRRAILDPITKTYRKRALFSLPVFSSTYSSSDTNPNIGINNSGDQTIMPRIQSSAEPSLSQKCEQSIPSVKKILIVDPNPKIASLLCKSMKSMFTSAEVVTMGCSEEALRLIQQPFTQINGPSSSSSACTAHFDILIVQQRLTPPGTSMDGSTSNEKELLNDIINNIGKSPIRLLDIFMRKNQEDSTKGAIASTSYGIRCGSDLIKQVSDLWHKHHQRCSKIPSCLLIGISVRPERDAGAMRRAGADIVWGIPIPSVGDTLRNKIFTKLLSKRSAVSSKCIKKEYLD